MIQYLVIHENVGAACVGGGATTLVANLPYHAQQLFNADVEIKDDKREESSTPPNVSITPDTGASTTIHNIDHNTWMRGFSCGECRLERKRILRGA